TIRLALGQCEVSASSRLHHKNRPFGTAATDDYEHVIGKDRRRRCDLRTSAEQPQLLSRARVITANEVGRVRNKYRPYRCHRNGRGAPRWNLLALGLPHRLACVSVEG